MTTRERGGLTYFAIMAAAGFAGGTVLFATGCDQIVAVATFSMGIVGAALFIRSVRKQRWFKETQKTRPPDW